MAKVRFLQSAYLVSQDISVNFNDEIEINDQKQIDRMVKKGLIDVLKEEKPTQKRATRKKKQPEKEVNEDEKDTENGDE